jgi:hypothetical protein
VSVDQVTFAGEPDVIWIDGKMNKENRNGPGWIPIKP